MIDVHKLMLVFSSSESIALAIPTHSVPLKYYLNQPQRLVHALINSDQVVCLGEKYFRLYLRTIVFFMLRIQPVVDLHITTGGDGTLHLNSVACDIQGNEFINQYFDLFLKGYLKPIPQTRSTRLVGQANLTVTVGIPPVLQFVPQPLLETTGNHLLKSVLTTMKQRLSHRLSADYRIWSEAQCSENTSPSSTQGLSQRLLQSNN